MEKLYPNSVVIVNSITNVRQNKKEIVTLPEGDYSTKKQIDAAMKKEKIKDFESYQIIRKDVTLRSGEITKEKHQKL